MSADENTNVEPVPVQLTRIEGTINLIAYQMTEVKTEVSKLGDRVTKVELVQAQSGGASQSWKTWLPILITLAGLLVAAYVAVSGG